MTTLPSYRNIIIRVYFVGTSILLGFYIIAFHLGIVLTENVTMERKISKVAPYHFTRFSNGESGTIKIDPLLTVYSDYELLPRDIQSNIKTEWQGVRNVLLEEEQEQEQEFQVFAQNIEVNGTQKIVYAVENSNAVEWNDSTLLMIEIFLVMMGVALFLLTILYISQSAKRISAPLLEVANRLENEPITNFMLLSTDDENCKELSLILKALNNYRSKLATQIEREQSFSRYVSHELRTPMMIMQSAISNFKQKSADKDKKALDKMTNALSQMEDLTHTFLLLARQEKLAQDETTIDNCFLKNIESEVASLVHINQVDFSYHLESPYTVSAHPLLVKSITLNLLKNAIGCSAGGAVTLFMSNRKIEIIDNGIGLDGKPRGQNGFGIGLTIVNDICEKYAWQFTLMNNEKEGCTAKVVF